MKLLHVSGSPHIRSALSTKIIMNSVTIALLPLVIVSVAVYEWNHIIPILLIGSFTAVISEGIFQKMFHLKLSYFDGSAFLTGLLLALTLGPRTPLWMPMIGSVVAIFSKQVFGGLGQNPFNPALIGRAVLLLSWPIESTTWIQPIKVLTTATPLSVYKMNEFGTVGLQKVFDTLGGTPSLAYKNLFLGFRSGSIGEVWIPALLIGFIFLVVRKIVSLQATVSFLITVIVLSYLFKLDILLMLMSGGILFAAFFMVTDYVTSPLLPGSQIIYGVGIGLINMLIRKYSGMPEGTTFAILIMNLISPLLDFKIKNPTGFVKEKSKQ